jgi:tetratricopeptide (TPR) repeat protein
MKSMARLAALIFLSSAIAVPAAFSQTPSRTIIHEEDPSDAAARETITKAEAAMDRKDFAAAAQICSDYLNDNPDNAAVHFQLGYAYSALGKADDAEEEYREAIDLDPKMGVAYLNLGVTLLESNPKEAAGTLQKAVDLMPDQPRPKYALGLALEHQGNDDAAITQFGAALALDARDFPARLELARTFLHAKKLADAATEFQKALALEPSSGAAHLGLAQTYFDEKRTAEASTELTQYLQANPKDVEARIQHASMLTELGNDEEALAELNRAASIRAENESTLQIRSLVEYRLKNYDAALAALKQVETVSPNDPVVHARIGHILLEKKDYAESTKELAIAFRVDPSQTEVLRDMIAAQYLGGSYATALESLDLLAKREALSNGSWFIRATCYDKIGKKQEALDGSRKFLELNSGRTNDEYFVASARLRALERDLKEKKK